MEVIAINYKRILLVIWGASLLACFSCVKKESTTDCIEEYKIAFNVIYDGANDDFEIFVMNADGSEHRNITQRPGVDWVYHAYKDRLYFISDRDSTSRKYFLYEMKWDGTEVKKITDFLVHDSWMSSRSNGAEFLVSRNENDNFDTRDLFIIDKEGNIVSQLTDDDFQNTDAHFSPDGKQVVFRSNRNGKGYSELFIINADGSNLKQLTFYPENDSTAMDWEYHAGPPQWPNDTTISYMSKQKGNYSIFTINPLNGRTHQVTRDTTEAGFPSNEARHTWTKDSKHIIFTATNLEGNFDIYRMKSDGTEIKRLTDYKKYEQAPVLVYPND